MERYPADASAYKLERRIGVGSFSSVWQATTGTELVSIKIMDLEHISTSFDDILQEVQTMRLCDDNNVLRCYCSFVNRDQLWLVTQYMDKGSCLRVMSLASELGLGKGMTEESVAYILREALQGLQYLHTNGQIHRDIKCGNILLDSAGAVRLADFGVSGWTLSRGTRVETVRTFVGTPCWMAPEVMEQVDGYDHRADIWSMGITALELAKGSAPYAKFAPMRVLVLTIEEDPPSLKSYENDKQPNGGPPFTRLFEEFYKKCLQKNPKLRPSAEELLKLKFFKNRDKTALVTQYLDKVPSVGAEDPIDVDKGVTEELDGFLEGTTRADEEPARPTVKDEHSTPASGVPSFDNSATIRTNPLTASSEIKSAPPSEGQREFAAGTTWVFDDFSTVDGELVEKPKNADINNKVEPSEEEQGKDLENFIDDMEGIVDI